MLIGFNPDVGAGFTKAIGRSKLALFRKLRRACVQKVKDRQSIADIFNLHIIGNDIALKPRLERFFQLSVGIEEEGLGFNSEKHVSVQLAFGVQNARLYRARLGRFTNVVRELSVQKTQAVISAYAKFDAVGKIKECPLE